MIWDEARLLEVEVDAIHGLEPGAAGGPARVRDPAVRAVWSWSPRARLLALGDGVPDPGPVEGLRQEYVPGEAPRVLTYLAGALAADGRRATVGGGPTFVFPSAGPLTDRRSASLPVVVSDPAGRERARRLARPGNWQPGEWAELTAGEAGEWAMAVHRDEPVCICFSPAANALAAEAGIWTRPDFRGRGLAPAVVTAWSHRERRNKQILFYSTTAANHASRSVARSLGLTALGWIWTLR